MSTKSRTIRALAGLALAGPLTLTGCGQSGPPTAGAAGPSSVSESVTAPVVAFGGTYTYPDGLGLRVEAPVGKERDRNADGTLTDPEDTFERYTVEVTVTNGTTGRVDLSGVRLDAVGGGQSGEWYASGDEPGAGLAPGRLVTFGMEFAVAGIDGLSVTVSPSWDRGPVVFELSSPEAGRGEQS